MFLKKKYHVYNSLTINLTQELMDDGVGTVLKHGMNKQHMLDKKVVYLFTVHTSKFLDFCLILKIHIYFQPKNNKVSATKLSCELVAYGLFNLRSP